MTEDVQSRFSTAVSLQQAGQTKAARATYDALLAIDPNHVGALINLANLCALDGALDEAAAYSERAVVLAPHDPQALRSAGIIHVQRGDSEWARQRLQNAISYDAADAEAAFYLGNLEQAEGNDDAAVARYQQAIAAAPDIPALHNNLGAALLSLKRSGEAIAALQRAIELRPDFAAAWNSLGNAYEAENDYEAALVAYDKALGHDPGLGAAWINRAQIRVDLGDLERAAAEITQYLEANPEDPVAHNALGLVHQRAARHPQAIAAFRHAMGLRNDYLQAITNLAISMMSTGRHDDALEFYIAAAELAPDLADTHVNLGHVYQTLGRHQDAAAAFRQALECDPSVEQVLPFLAHALMYLCEWDDFDSVIRQMLDSLTRRRDAGEEVSAPPFGVAGTPASPALRLAVARSVSKEIERTMRGQATAAAVRQPTIERDKIRVGYVSPDFREHSLGMVFQGLLAAHSRDEFSWYGYSVSPRPDLSFTSYERDFDGFVDLGPLSFAESVDRIRADDIDILIDLAGHTRDSGLELFALRPAPIQVHYLGYGATVGADFIDYLITDPVHTPSELAPHCSESLIYLPDSFMAATPAEVSSRVFTRAECGLPDDAVVFAAFNAHYKIDPTMFAAWMRILQRVAGGVLWLREGSTLAQQNLRRAAAAHGIDPRRLIFAGRLDRAEHLARHRLADLALDTLYHVGGVTTIDALWTGVPVLTIAGAAHSMRTGASMLSAIDLPQLVTPTIEAYEALAVDLANNAERRGALRAELDQKRLREPLFNPHRLARHLEQSYRTIWQRYQAGSGPSDIHIAPLADDT